MCTFAAKFLTHNKIKRCKVISLSKNSTRLHFGKEALNKLRDELQNYGPKVMLTYGGDKAADLENYADA